MMNEGSGEMMDGQGEGSKYRLKVLRIPTPRFRILSLVGLSVLVVMGMLIGGTLGGVATIMIPERFEVLRVIVAVTFAGLGLAASIWWWGEARHARLVRNPPWRTERLKRIIAGSESGERFPHRLIEASLRSFDPLKKKIRTATRGIRPRDLIIVVSRSDEGLILPSPSEVDLEPVEICNESETIFDNNGAFPVGAIRSGELRTAAATEVVEAKEPEVEWHPTRWRKLSPVARWIGFAFWVGIILDRAMNGGLGDLAWYMGLGAIGGFFFGPFGRGLFFERRWWLVPGGLAYREVAAWRKGMRVALITPEDSTLVLDWRSGDAYVHDGSRGLHFKCGEHACWAVASMWMSTTRRRTVSEMRSFFGADEE